MLDVPSMEGLERLRTQQALEVDLHACLHQFLRKLCLPGARVVELDEQDAMEVRRHFDALFKQAADLVPPELPCKVAQFEDDVLPRTRCLVLSIGCSRTNVIGGEKYNSEANIGIGFELLNDGTSFVCFLVQDDCF